MSLRKTILLGVVLAIVVCYIRAVELPRETAVIESSQPYRSIPVEQISEIMITRPSGAFRILNERVEGAGASPAPTPDALAAASVDRADRWRLADAPSGSLDRGVINSLLSSISNLTLGKPIPTGELDGDRSVYGLTEPPLTLVVKREGGSREFVFGALNDYVSKRYVAVDGGIYLVPDALFTAADRPRDDFRNRSPISFVESDLKGLSIKTPREEIVFTLDEVYRWRMVKPAAHGASDGAMANLARELRSLKTAEFIDAPGPLETYGLKEPVLTVTLDFKPEVRSTPLVIEIGVPPGAKPQDEAAYARIAGLDGILRLSANPIDAIVKDSSAFRERAVLRFSSDLVEDVTIEPKDGEKLSLVRAGDEWQVNGQPGDAPFVRDFIRNLSNFEVDSFAAPGPAHGFDAPTLKVTVNLRAAAPGGASSKRVLIVGARSMDGPRETGYYGGVDDLTEPFVIGAEKLKLLSPHREALVKTSGDPAAAAGENPLAELAESSDE